MAKQSPTPPMLRRFQTYRAVTATGTWAVITALASFIVFYNSLRQSQGTDIDDEFAGLALLIAAIFGWAIAIGLSAAAIALPAHTTKRDEVRAVSITKLISKITLALLFIVPIALMIVIRSPAN